MKKIILLSILGNLVLINNGFSADYCLQNSTSKILYFQTDGSQIPRGPGGAWVRRSFSPPVTICDSNKQCMPVEPGNWIIRNSARNLGYTVEQAGTCEVQTGHPTWKPFP